ncbi:MAG TPA: 2OG-Fe(II) oxygenase [Arenicellales bacterium]|jgi:predicted 2-oxoglutarate/Fe(II)-dependent dioxygenase YbiX|nr:2OG-Fe(II) oxygenase [Gammaproteobacteria bacterium]HJP10635.1 2OG-Fe(II) oxygenase [Arenicellales bacterium]|tara:strand:- start:6499 stop:7122 length:624 start_codon:yes stop_codon:yes gene_type:complete
MNSPQLLLSDYVKVYKNCFTKSFCETVIEEFDSDCSQKAPVDWRGNLEVLSQYRDAALYSINAKEQEPVSDLRRSITKTLTDTLTIQLENYLQETHLYVDNVICKKFFNGSNDGFRFLRYDVGGHCAEHTDQCVSAETTRVITCSINLNDNYEGGHTLFFPLYPHSNRVHIPPQTGQLILFPSNFLYPHIVTKVTSGARYQIITWIT